jgi:ABC-type transport system involved in cytochrome c biogenesis permease component
MTSFWSITLFTLAKDIRLEWRSKDALNAMLFFSLLVVVIFVFSFDPLAEESRHIVGGLVWVAFLFAAVVALNQTWALVVNGTFFAAMSVRTRSRELMLPLLLFPVSIPAVISMVAGTTNILTGEDSAHFFIVLLLTYDVVFTTACLALFETVLQAE